MARELKLFDISKTILTKKDVSDDPMFDKVYSKFIISRHLSCDKATLPVVQLLNVKQGYLDNLMHYRYFFNLVPKSNKFIKYLCKKQPTKEDLESIARYFNTGISEAEDIIKLLSKKEIKEISKIFKR